MKDMMVVLIFRRVLIIDDIIKICNFKEQNNNDRTLFTPRNGEHLD